MNEWKNLHHFRSHSAEAPKTNNLTRFAIFAFFLNWRTADTGTLTSPVLQLISKHMHHCLQVGRMTAHTKGITLGNAIVIDTKKITDLLIGTLIQLTYESLGSLSWIE